MVLYYPLLQVPQLMLTSILSVPPTLSEGSGPPGQKSFIWRVYAL